MATKKSRDSRFESFLASQKNKSLLTKENRLFYFGSSQKKRQKSRKNLCSNKTTALCEKKQLNNNDIPVFFFSDFSLEAIFILVAMARSDN